MCAAHVTSIEDLQAFVAEETEKTGHSELLVLVAILEVLRREQEQRADDLERVAQVGLVRLLVVGELRRLWAQRSVPQSVTLTGAAEPAD